jgi:hypothetical protein
MGSRGWGVVAVLAILAIGPIATADAADTVIGFDDLGDGTFVSSQYHGLGVDLALATSDFPKVRTAGVGIACWTSAAARLRSALLSRP